VVAAAVAPVDPADRAEQILLSSDFCQRGPLGPLCRSGLKARRKGKVRSFARRPFDRTHGCQTTSSRQRSPMICTPAGTLQIVNVTTALAGILTDAFSREAGYQ